MHGRARAVGTIGLLGSVVLVAALGLGGCVDEEAVQAAKARKEALLASTVPKAELWAEVERRGRAVKKGAEILAAIPPIEARIASIAAELASLNARSTAVAERAGQVDLERLAAERELAAARADVERLEAIARGLGAPERAK